MKLSSCIRFVTILTYLLNCAWSCCAQSGSCNKVTSCKCKYDDGSIVDLTDVGNTDGTARFQDVPGAVATTLYSWNPCSGFTEGDCTDVAVCQLQEDLPPVIYTSLGTQDSATFTKDDDGNLAIQYDVEEKGVLKTARVSLICDENSIDSLNVKEEDKGEAKYVLELTSPHACPVDSATSSDQLSVGTYIIIIFSTTTVIFFIVGVLVQKFVRKQTGRNVIPFVEFWIQFPALVKEGVMLIVCRGKRAGYSSA